MTEPTFPSRRDAIRAEAERIHESAVYCAQGQFESAKRWRMCHWSLGAVSAGLGTIGAVITFADVSQILGGSLTVLAAIGAAVMTGVRPDKLAERAQNSGNDYTTLRNDVRRFRHIDVPNDSDADLREMLEVLATRASELDQAADPIPRWAYERAKKNIEAEGGQDFEADRP